MVNSRKIKAKMCELGITQKHLAIDLKLAVPTVSQKINNVRPMSLDEADTISKVLKIHDSEFKDYFLCILVA